MTEKTPKERFEEEIRKSQEWLEPPVESPSAGIIEIPTFTDERGSLTVADGNPFFAKRVFWVYGNEDKKERGDHAHDVCDQLLVVLRGNARVTLISPEGEKRLFSLDRPDRGLFVPAGEFINYVISDNSVLLVLCSEQYDENDYNENIPTTSR